MQTALSASWTWWFARLKLNVNWICKVESAREFFSLFVDGHANLNQQPRCCLQGRGRRDLLVSPLDPMIWRAISMGSARTRIWSEASQNSRNLMQFRNLRRCWFSWCGENECDVVEVVQMYRRNLRAIPAMQWTHQPTLENPPFGHRTPLGPPGLQFMNTPFEWSRRWRWSTFLAWPSRCASRSFHLGSGIALRSFRLPCSMTETFLPIKSHKCPQSPVAWHLYRDQFVTNIHSLCWSWGVALGQIFVHTLFRVGAA